MTAPAPFLDWLVVRVGAAHWVVAPRLSPRMKEKGYALAIPPARYTALQAEWQALCDHDRAERIALRLFPDDYFNGRDCRSEYGREGLPCNVCADKLATWNNRIQAVAGALTAES